MRLHTLYPLITGEQILAASSCGLEHDLHAIVLLVIEDLKSFRSVIKGHAVRDDKARINLALFDSFKQWLHVALHVALTGSDRQ